MRDAEIQKIVTQVLRDRMASRGFLSCDAKSEEDFDGVSIIRVKAIAKQTVDKAEDRLNLTMAIRQELHEQGDDRYVYLNLTTPAQEDGQKEDHDEDDWIDDAPDNSTGANGVDRDTISH